MRWPILIALMLLALSGYGRSMPMLIQQSATGATLVGADLNDPNVVPPPTGVTCTTGIGPFTSATSMTTISNTINALDPAGGQIVCLQRGQTWTSGTLSLTASFPNGNRVTICASTGSSCTDSGAANPKCTNAGNAHCYQVSSGGGGYTFKNLDAFATSNGTSAAWEIQRNTSNITIEGGVIDGFWQAFGLDGGSLGAGATNNTKIGTCAAVMEIRGTPANTGGARTVWFGELQHSSISVYIHDFNSYRTNSQDHWLDLSTNGFIGYNQTGAGLDITLECSHLVLPNDSVTGGNMGVLVKFAKGQTAVIRDNLFEYVSGSCSEAPIGFDSHADPSVEGWDGAEVYRNRFYTGPCGAIDVTNGRNLNIYNNLVVQSGGNQRGFVQSNFQQGVGDIPNENVAIFDNTVIRTGTTSDTYGLISETPGIAGGRVPGTGYSLRNNILYDTNTTGGQGAKIWEAPVSGCNGFGTNGANIKNNFIYTPNDSTPTYWSGCSGASGNSSTFATSPALVNVGANDLHPATSASPPCNFGTTPQATADFDLVTRGTPPDVGAYECP